jgi:hypothetical protein
MVWFAYFAGPERFSNLIDYGVTHKTGKVTRRDRFPAPYAFKKIPDPNIPPTRTSSPVR